MNHKRKRQFSKHRCHCKIWKMTPTTRDRKLRPNEQRKLGLKPGAF